MSKACTITFEVESAADVPEVLEQLAAKLRRCDPTLTEYSLPVTVKGNIHGQIVVDFPDSLCHKTHYWGPCITQTIGRDLPNNRE